MVPKLQTIIDQGGRMRFNLYPFTEPKHCTSVVVKLPVGNLSKDEDYAGEYREVTITRVARYCNHGAICHPEVSKWICANGYSRKKGDDIHIFAFEFKTIGDEHHYRITKYLGTRHPGR